jgi:hypothetical protein
MNKDAESFASTLVLLSLLFLIEAKMEEIRED